MCVYQKTFRCQTLCWSNMLLSTIIFMPLCAALSLHTHIRSWCLGALFLCCSPQGFTERINQGPFLSDQSRFNWPWYVSFSASLMKLTIQSTSGEVVVVAIWRGVCNIGKMKRWVVTITGCSRPVKWTSKMFTRIFTTYQVWFDVLQHSEWEIGIQMGSNDSWKASHFPGI